MNEIMQWDRCEREFIRKASIDKEKIASIIETALKRRKFLEDANVDENNVSFIVEGFYEIVKELLVALLLMEGMRSSNHQCLISYFNRKFPDHEFEVNLISQMSYLRNRLDYYGEKIDKGFYDKNKKDIQELINLLLTLTIKNPSHSKLWDL